MINRLRANSMMNLRDDSSLPMALATPDRWLIYPNAAFADAWGSMAAADPELRIPRIPPDWLQGTPATPFSHGWIPRCRTIDDGLRIELLPLDHCGAMARLTRRESEVASLYSHGYSHKEIGRLLRMAPNTARGHISRIFEKLEISSRTQLRSLVGNIAPPLPSGSDSKHS